MSSKTDNKSATQNTTSEPKKQEQPQSLSNGMTPENAKALNIMKNKRR